MIRMRSSLSWALSLASPFTLVMASASFMEACGGTASPPAASPPSSVAPPAISTPSVTSTQATEPAEAASPAEPAPAPDAPPATSEAPPPPCIDGQILMGACICDRGKGVDATGHCVFMPCPSEHGGVTFRDADTGQCMECRAGTRPTKDGHCEP